MGICPDHVLVQLEKLASLHEKDPVYHDAGDLGAGGCINEVWNEVPDRFRQHWTQAGLRQVDQDQVGSLAHLDRTHLPVQPQRPGAFYGRHAQHFPRRHDGGVPIPDLVEECGELHFVENVTAVVARRLVGPQCHGTSGVPKDPCRRHDAIDDPDGS